VPTKRLPNKHDRPAVDVLDPHLDICRVSGTRQITRTALASTVPTGVRSKDTMTLRQPRRSLPPLHRVTGKTMQHDDGTAAATKVRTHKTNSIPLKPLPANSHI